MKLFLFIFIFFLITNAFSQTNEKVIYKYKEYEKFDLGDLEVKGSVVAPGDISVKERKRKVFENPLYKRTSFRELMIQDVKNLR